MMAKLGTGTMTVACPVCGDDWDVRVEGRMVLGRRPGTAKATFTIGKPLRIPSAHRKCVGKVD